MGTDYIITRTQRKGGGEEKQPFINRQRGVFEREEGQHKTDGKKENRGKGITWEKKIKNRKERSKGAEKKRGFIRAGPKQRRFKEVRYYKG